MTTTSVSGTGAGDHAEDAHRRRSLSQAPTSVSPRAVLEGGDEGVVIIIDDESDEDDDNSGDGQAASASHFVEVAAAAAEEDGEDTLLFRSEADMGEPHPIDGRAPPLRGRSPAKTSQPDPRTPPPPLRTLAATHKRGDDDDGDEELRGRRGECSPEALTADSESKRSSHRWQRQLLAGSTPSTQRLREEDAADSASRRGGGGHAHSHGVDKSAHAPRAAGHATPEAVKQLFSQRPRSISLASLSDIADSPEDTLIMAATSDADDEDGGVHGQPRRPSRAHPPRPLDVSSIASASRSRWSEGSTADTATSRPPPGSASAQTPPPTASLSLRAASGLPPLRSSTDLLLQRQPTHLSATQSSDRPDDAHRAVHGSPRSGSGIVPDALPSPLPKTSSQATAPAAASPYAPSAGHLRMHGSSWSRQSSPAAPASAPSAPAWRTKMGAATAETARSSPPTTAISTITTPPHATPPASSATAFPAHPIAPSHPTHVYLHPRFPSPAHSRGTSSPLSRLADHEVLRMETDAEADATTSISALSASTPSQPWLGGTPQRLLRLRDPPVWRSPQPAHLPTSLNVSPASLGGGGGRAHAVLHSPPAETTSARAPSPTQPLVHASSAASAGTATAAATAVPPLSSRVVPATVGHSEGTSRATSVATQPLASAAGRPSTQLITKAAATRPVASPGTMWICLDDDDSDGVDVDAEDERAEPAEGTGSGGGARHASRVLVKQELEAEEDGQQTPVLPANAGIATPVDAQHSEGGVLARPRSGRSSSPSRGSGAAGAHGGDAAASPLRRRPPPETSNPIAEILSPTFRPRRRPPDAPSGPTPAAAVPAKPGRPVPAQESPAHTTTGRVARPLQDGAVRLPTSPQHYICLDDDDEEDEEGEEEEDAETMDGGHTTAPEEEREMDRVEAPPRKRTRVSPRDAHPPHGSGSGDVTPPLSLPLIIDDDDEEEERVTKARVAAAAAHQRTTGDVWPATATATTPPAVPPAVSRADHDDGDEEGGGENALRSPLKPNVRDFIFPNRLDPELRPASPLYESIHAYQQHYQQQHHHRHEDDDADDNAAGPRTNAKANTAAAARAAVPQREKKRPRRASATLTAPPVVPSLPDWGRPADALLRDFFSTKFTKKSFMDAARRVLSPMHFLDDGDFWAAFASAEFVGEGSFGLVWRCRTVDGDLVAVKSCPIILRTKANIEDSFSTIREIATMRFLNEMQVPYVLPLHSAFFVHGREALPPAAQAALEWRRRLRREAEALAAQEVEVLKLGRSGNAAGAHTTATGASSAAKDAPATFEQHVAQQLERIAAAEGPQARATRAAMHAVRLPRFLSITEDDLTQSDATAFLVMELCDGDVEGIPRSDRVAKGVAYCVSSALAAMHELGLLHLDLKPSNVLFAYEHGPSQQTAAAVAAASSASGPPAMDAVKFYLSDFGNCRLVGPDAMAEVEDAYGTFEYMDHRALRDAVCGRPTDAFSLGATLYELLFGRRLYPKCTNPDCTAEEDHTRDCFVAAASKPVKLLTSTGAVLGVAAPANAGRGRGRGGRGAAKETSSSAAAVRAPSAAGPPLSPLQHLTLELLRHTWAARMTAEECRRYLVEAFHIMQADYTPS